VARDSKQGYSVDKSGGGGGGGRPWILIGGVVLVVAALLAGAVAVASSVHLGGSKDLKTALKDGGCTSQQFPTAKNEASAHVDPNDKAAVAKVHWDSDPPTHGPHDPTPALWGIYDTEVDQAKLIHNMEHAGIVVQYGPKVSSSEVDSLIGDIQNDYKWTVAAPYSKLGNKISFEYWGHLTTCTTYEKAVLTDLQSHRNKPGWSQESQAYPNGRDWTQEAKLPGFE
jgi:hypothetical protein